MFLDRTIIMPDTGCKEWSYDTKKWGHPPIKNGEVIAVPIFTRGNL